MRKGKRWTRLLSLLLVMMMSCSLLAGFSAQADEVQKYEVTHDIAIVFDNSGSMYKKESWSQALYAIEVFASMVNYNRDKLGVYPMGKIEIKKDDGTISETVTERLNIASKDDVKKIENIYSPKGADTILKPAYSAMEYLKKSDKDEKWLIVLTDGYFTKDKSESEPVENKDGAWLRDKLDAFAKSSDVKVQYLGFTEESPSVDELKSDLFDKVKVVTGDDLIKALVDICNKVFSRNIMKLDGSGRFTTDVSMKNIVAFVQGKTAVINGLEDVSGKSVEVDSNIKLNAPDKGIGVKGYPAPVADMAGQVVTFKGCTPGTYELDYTGSNVQIFYEPDVAIKTVLKDANGKEVDTSKSVEYGEYTLEYYLADKNTGEDVSKSKLLDPVKLNKAIVKNGDKETQVASGEKITLSPDSDTVIDITGTYLKVYKITNNRDGEAFKLDVKGPNASDLDVTVKVTNLDAGVKWYKLSKHEDWKPIRVDVSYKGKPVADELLKDAIEVSFTPEDKNMAYRVELLPGESAYDIYIGSDKNGGYVEPAQGNYKVHAKVTVNEKGIPVSASDSDRFEVRNHSAIWRWLIWIVIIVGLIILIIIILNLPAWPRHIRYVVERPKAEEGLRATVKIRSTSMPIIPYDDALFCKAKKNSKVKDWLFKPKSMSIVASNFTSQEIRAFSYGGHNYTPKDGEFACRGVDSEILFNGSQFTYTALNGTKGSGHIEIY